MPLGLMFLSPYLSLCQIASWGIAQNLEGLHLFGYLNNFYMDGVSYPIWNLSPIQGVIILSMLYTPLLFATFAFNVRACFYLSNKIGFISLATWLLPGILAVNGIVFDFKSLAPDQFEFSEGFPGGVGSTAVNLLVFLILGWSLWLLVGSRWKREKVKNVYDHFWYPVGLVTALYFVANAGLNSYIKDINDANERLTQTLQLYTKSVDNITVACKESPQFLTHAATLCRLADNMRREILSELQLNPTAKARTQSYSFDWTKTLSTNYDGAIVREIDFANIWGCGRSIHLKACFNVPPETAITMNDIDRHYFFLPNTYVRAIDKDLAAMAKYDDKITTIRQSYNFRYFAFILVAFLAGGKIANVSRSLMPADKGKPISWIAWCIRTYYVDMVALYCTLRATISDSTAK